MIGKVAPGTMLGKYRIEVPIGRGGFSTVYRATQTGPGGFNRSVALKLLRQQQDESSRDMALFFREARIIATLSHRNVVQVFELAQERGVYFLVMELVEGATLSRLLDRGPIDPHLAVGVAVEVNRALCYAHSRGVIHRDIKPSNILISEQGDVKVADFGLAKIVGADQLSAIGEVRGTLGYMSPEQRAGLPATPKSDVYALALVLLRMCSSEAPARSATGEVLDLACGVAPDPIRPAAARALQADPEQRPDSGELGEALRQALAQLATGDRIARLADELAQKVRRVQQGAGPPPTREGNTVAAKGSNPFVPRLEARPESAAPQAREPAGRVRIWAVAAGAALLIALAAGVGLLLGRTDRARQPTPSLPPPPTPPVVRAPAHPTVDARGEEPVDARIVEPASRAVVPRGPSPRLRRSSPRKRRKPTRAGVGTLTVTTDPWSVVFLDGRKLGMTPLYRVPVPAGLHRITLVPSKGRRVVRQINVAPKQHHNLGMILLR